MTDPRIEAAAQWLYDWSVEDRGLNPGIHTWPPPGEWPDTWRKVNGARQRSRTHCKRGHEFTVDNTYFYPNGERECRTCRRTVHRPRIQQQKGVPA